MTRWPATIGATPRERIERRRRIAVLAPIALLATTYPVFLVAQAMFGDAAGGRLAWFVGMSAYWLGWGWLFTRWMLGPSRMKALLRPRRPSGEGLGHVAFIVAMAALVRYSIPGMGYEEPAVGGVVLLAVSPFTNGLFEELLWRGVYLEYFPHRFTLRVLWPSAWFGLWHLVPGAISPGGPHVAMVVGPFLMGLYLAYVARRTNSVWWPMLAHTLGGIVMIS